MRILGAIRLSKDADEAGTSIERQQESIETWSKMLGHEIVGWAVDSGVSGSVSPFEMPELGQWLKQPKLSEWDALVAYRLDRLSRRVIPLNKLFGFIQEHGKTLASVSESLDLSTWIGRLVANVIAGVAEGELEAIRERNQGSQKTVRELGRWHGGPTPYGYIAEKRDSGYYLVPQPAERDVIRGVILPRVLAHESTRSIAEKLNEAKAVPRRASEWGPQVLRQMLRGRSLIGQTVHKGRVVTDGAGLPLQIAEPILTPDEYIRVQLALAARSIRVNSRQLNPLSGLIRCYWCESPLHHQVMNKKGRRPAYYRCGKRGRGCSQSRAVRVDIAYELAEEQFLSSVGDVQRCAKVFVPGRDSRQSVGDIEAAIAVCRRERDLGLYEGDDESYLERLGGLAKRLKDLKDLPASPGFEWKPLGETYGEAWKTLGVEQRRTLLLDSGIQLFIGRGEGNQFFGRIYVPEEIQELLSK